MEEYVTVLLEREEAELVIDELRGFLDSTNMVSVEENSELDDLPAEVFDEVDRVHAARIQLILGKLKKALGR